MSRITHWVAMVLVLLMAPTGHGDNRFWLGGQRSARVLGMGGCYTANTRAGEAHLFNPAGLRLQHSRLPFILTVDPLVLALPPDLAGDDHSSYADALPGLAGIRGLYLGNAHVGLGLVPAEYVPGGFEELEDTPATGTVEPERFTPSVVFAVCLDERISLGLAGSYRWDERHLNRRLSVSYGLLVRVNKVMDVGAVAVNLGGDGQATDRRWLDRVDDRTINVGLSWYPMGRSDLALGNDAVSGNRDLQLKISSDIRNVTQEGQGFNSQEMHLGASLAFRELIEVRSGVYWPEDPQFVSQAPVRSLSVGVLRGSLRRLSRQPLPFDTLLDLTWMDNPRITRGNGLFIASMALGF